MHSRPSFKDFELQATLKGQNMDNSDVKDNHKAIVLVELIYFQPQRLKLTASSLGPKLANFENVVPESGDWRKKKGPREYICTRASGLSAPQNQQLMGSKNVAKTVSSRRLDQKLWHFTRKHYNSADNAPQETCCVCTEVYSWEDQMVFTKCCGIAIGAQCNAKHIADWGECWNCGEEAVHSEAASEAETWVSWDLKDCRTQASRLPRYPKHANPNPAKNPGRHQPSAMLKAGSTLPSGSTTESSNTPGTSHTQDSKPLQAIQSHVSGLTENQNAREAAKYQSKSAKQNTKAVRTAPESSLNLMTGPMKNNDIVSGGFDKVDAMSSIEQQDFLYAGSVSADSNPSEDDQQHLPGQNEEERERQEAKQHVIEAIQHLVEMCNAYGEEISEADKDEVINVILEAVGGKSTLQLMTQRPRLKCF